MRYDKGRVNEVAQILGQRLLNIKKFESAGDIFESVNLFEKAIDSFLTIKKFDRAMECASNVRPIEL